VKDLLDDLHLRGVKLAAHGDKRHLDAPRGVLTADLVDRLRTHKAELLRLLAGPLTVGVSAATPVATTALTPTPPAPASAAPPPAQPPVGRYEPDVRLGDYRNALTDVRARLILTSPPYNIGSKAPRKDGMRKHGKYDQKSFGAIRDYPDDLPEPEYQDSQEALLLWCADHLIKDGVLAYNHKPRHRNHCLISPHEWFLRPAVRKRLTQVDEIVWDRGSTHNHDPHMFWPTTERVYVFRRTDGPYRFRNHKDLPHRDDVWRINRAKNIGHCSPFPLELVETAILAWSGLGDLVCDPYLGSGTAAVVARKLGRRFVGSEQQKTYHQLALDRLKAGDV
jgi:DNA modification methylase